MAADAAVKVAPADAVPVDVAVKAAPADVAPVDAAAKVVVADAAAKVVVADVAVKAAKVADAAAKVVVVAAKVVAKVVVGLSHHDLPNHRAAQKACSSHRSDHCDGFFWDSLPRGGLGWPSGPRHTGAGSAPHLGIA